MRFLCGGHLGLHESKYLTIAQGKGVNLVNLIPGQDPARMDHIVSAFDQLIRVKVEKVS